MITFLAVLASLTTGAYIGSVVDDKLDTPVQINTQTTTVDSGIFNLSKSDLLKYSLMGLLAFYIYKRYFKK